MSISCEYSSRASELKPCTSDWVNIKEMLPDEMTTVLVCLSSEVVTIGFLCEGDWVVELEKIWLRGDEDVEVTHWTPFPELPTVLDDEVEILRLKGRRSVV